MARRSEHTQEDLRKMAIDAGSALIEQRGYQEFSARAVAASMGYTVGTLYHLFGDLDHFMLHINARTLDQWYSHFGSQLPVKPEARVRVYAQGYYIFAKENYNRWLALFEHKMKPEDIPEWFRPKMAQMFDIFEQAVLVHTDNDKKKAAKLSKILWASVHGICVLSLAGKLDQVKAERAEKMIDDLLVLALKGG
jgi:AcrR family transcriptional regulator